MTRIYKYIDGKLKSDIFATKSQLKDLVAKVEAISSSGGGSSSGGTIDDSVLAELKAQIASLEEQIGTTTSDSKEITSEELLELQEQIDALNTLLASYASTPVISSFVLSGASQVNDTGTTIVNVKFNWGINANLSTIDKITIKPGSSAEVELGSSIRTYTFSNENLSAQRTYTLKVYYTKDNVQSTVSKSYVIYFNHPIIYGVSSTTSGIDSSFITSLDKRARNANLGKSNNSFEGSFTADTDEYFYYAIPKDWVSRLQISINYGINVTNGGFVVIDSDSKAYYYDINSIPDTYTGFDITIGTDTTNYVLLRTELSGLGSIYFTSKTK